MIENILRKNLKKRLSWAKQTQVEAYRLYDWQIPEYPFYIDVYKKEVVVYDRTEVRDEPRKDQMIQEVDKALRSLLNLSENAIFWKMRQRQKGRDQYEKIDLKNRRQVIQEGPRKYYVNLHDYLDTGLFLDHRPLRNQFQKKNQGRFLNLFSYTCSVGLAAALGGAKTTNVDISKTYLNWGKDNYTLNDMDPKEHEFIHGDVLAWLQNERSTFDVIFLDPPSFSNSKRMSSSSFDVLRDQDILVQNCLDLLNPGGVLYFSNNHSKFRLSEQNKKLNPQDITQKTIPQDFHNQKVHWCFAFKKPEISSQDKR